MAAGKIGPWRAADYEGFIALETEPPPPEPKQQTLTGLMGSYLQGMNPRAPEDDDIVRRQAEFLAHAWQIRRNHPIYTWLQGNADFRAAWTAFQRIRKRSALPKLRLPNAELVFLRDFVKYAGWVFMWGSQFKKGRGPYANRRRSAAKHAEALVQLLDAGVRLENYSDHEKLQSLLRSLIAELSATRRKPYGGERENHRALLKIFAGQLLMDFELKSPTVVTEFARMVGVTCDLRTAKRYCDEQAETRRRMRARMLADALAKPDTKQAKMD